mmetsp:Transcript_45008/g.82242  ORF Transcript_45008/g.82242 Transcript_45008/m.82242 type:complete len:258 (-) Transcript_45008:794-1567(-)
MSFMACLSPFLASCWRASTYAYRTAGSASLEQLDKSWVTCWSNLSTSLPIASIAVERTELAESLMHRVTTSNACCFCSTAWEDMPTNACIASIRPSATSPYKICARNNTRSIACGNILLLSSRMRWSRPWKPPSPCKIAFMSMASSLLLLHVAVIVFTATPPALSNVSMVKWPSSEKSFTRRSTSLMYSADIAIRTSTCGLELATSISCTHHRRLYKSALVVCKQHIPYPPACCWMAVDSMTDLKGLIANCSAMLGP